MPSCPATDSIRAGDDGRANPEKQGDGTMTDTWTADIAWWITAVELTTLGGLFWLIWRTRRDGETAERRWTRRVAVPTRRSVRFARSSAPYSSWGAEGHTSRLQ